MQMPSCIAPLVFTEPDASPGPVFEALLSAPP
jgi:hypothetical protein